MWVVFLLHHTQKIPFLVVFNARHTLTRDIDIAILSVRLSVRPSVRCVTVLTYCHNFLRHGSPIMVTIDVFDVLCAQLTRDLFAIAKFLFF